LQEKPSSSTGLQWFDHVMYNFEAPKIPNHWLLGGEQYVELATTLKEDCQRLLEVALLDEMIAFIKNQHEPIHAITKGSKHFDELQHFWNYARIIAEEACVGWRTTPRSTGTTGSIARRHTLMFKGMYNAISPCSRALSNASISERPEVGSNTTYLALEQHASLDCLQDRGFSNSMACL
jgi:hypothetical protein